MLLHLVLSLVLYLLINKIGRLSYGLGYSSLSDIFEEDNSISYNALIRILSPSVFIVFASIIGYKYYPEIINNIWMISIYYLIIMLCVISILNRWYFLNKFKFFFYNFISILLSIYIYNSYIIFGIDYLLPNKSNVNTELWFLIGIFFYKILDYPYQGSYEKQEEKLNLYIDNKYKSFSNQYGELLNKYEGRFQKIIYSIMILEDFNRPTQIRNIEYFAYYIKKIFKKETSTGIMQIKSLDKLSDLDSVNYAIKLLYPEFKKEIKNQNFDISNILKKYNGANYYSKISEIYYKIPIEDEVSNIDDPMNVIELIKLKFKELL